MLNDTNSATAFLKPQPFSNFLLIFCTRGEQCRVPVAASRNALELWLQPRFSLILPASVWIFYSPSLEFRCCVSLSADSSSTLFRCLVLSQGDSLGDPVFTSLFYSTFYKSALFVYTQKCLSFLLFAVVFTSDAFSSLVPSPFLFSATWLCCLRAAVLSICFRF